MPDVRLVNVTKTFEGGRIVAVDHVNLHVRECVQKGADAAPIPPHDDHGHGEAEDKVYPRGQGGYLKRCHGGG